jgi:copper(I)-binding protein
LEAGENILKNRRLTATIAALIGGLMFVWPISAARAVITINQPWMRPTNRTYGTEVYMDATSSEGALLMSVQTDAAATATLLAPGRRIAPVANVKLPPRTMVAFAPRAWRIALSGMRRRLNVGDRVMLLLTVEMSDGSRQDIPVDAEVRMHSPIDDESHAHGHTHMPH